MPPPINSQHPLFTDSNQSLNMFAKLLDLPDELLTQIISYLDTSRIKVNREGRKELTNSRPSLCALALVNHRLSAISCRILFEDVFLYLKDGPHLPLDALRFAQCCEDNPAVLRRMRKIYIRWDFCTPAGWAWDLWEAIGIAKNLKVLQMESFHGFSDEEILPSIIEYLVTRLRTLEVLVLNIVHLTLSPRIFSKIFLCLPNLQVFETNSQIREPVPSPDSVISSYDSPEGDQFYAIPTTNLTSLCCSASYSNPEILQNVLSKSPSLVKLRVNWPILTTSQDFSIALAPSFGTFLGPSPFIDPAAITRMLQLCAKSLRELVLVSTTFRPSEIGEHAIDLSWLRGLLRVTISIRMLRKIEHQISTSTVSDDHLPSHDWFQSLPSGLQRLEIQFDTPRGLFWDLSELQSLNGYSQTTRPQLNTACRKEAYREMCSDFGQRLFEPRIGLEIATVNRLSWMTDTIKREPGCLEYLKSFRVVEIPSWNYRRSLWDLLDLAKVYPEVVGCPKLDFELLVRTPFEYTPPSFTTLRSQALNETFNSMP